MRFQRWIRNIASKYPMTTEPYIKSRNALAGVYGASASSFVFLLLLIYLTLSPSVPGDDASIRGAAILLGIIPPLWIVLFIYFLALSFKSNNKIRFMFSLQTVWVTILSGLLTSVALSHEGWAAALPVFGVTFLMLWVIIGVGSWCSTLAK